VRLCRSHKSFGLSSLKLGRALRGPFFVAEVRGRGVLDDGRRCDYQWRLKARPTRQQGGSTMKRIILAAAALVVMSTGAPAADRIRLGFQAGLSGVGIGGAVGEEQRRGLELALGELGNKLGGLPVSLYVEDDTGNPSVAVQVASKLIDEDHIDIVTGLTGSNTLIPVEKTYLAAGVFVVGALAGPQEFAGKACSPDAFHSSFENEDWDDALGTYMTDKGVKSVYFMGADYQAGWEKIAGAMRFYKGKAIGPVYTPLSQLDFAAELTQLEAAKPDAVYVFYPGGLGIAFLKQFYQAGLHGKIAIYSEDTIASELSFAAEGDSALGIIQSTSWTPDLDNAANKAFVAAFTAKYGRRPTIFSALQYDAVKLIDQAVREVHGKIEDKAAFRAALERADFHSVRGPFKFDNNHYPVQNIYITTVERDAQGKLTTVLQGTAVKNWHDLYHDQCKMTG
jgi:branched-chain amino acid transport system substrate-binding protein